MATLTETDDVIYPSPLTASPRSRRVGMANPPAGFNLSSSTHEPSPHSPHSPPIPPRSPLRPPPRRSLSSSTNTPPDSPIIADTMFSSLQLRNRSFVALLESLNAQDDQHAILNKQLPERPVSPISISPMDDEPASSTSSLVNSPTPVSKRNHALLELLSSERAYASDLALIRTVHIPLALGEPPPFHTVPVTPPHSSGSSSRTMSTASDSSTTSSMASPPMTRADTKIIFSNVPELALFADLFTEMLEEALGSVLEGGHGEDHVGALFLETIPSLEPPYKLYITRHPTALAHLGALPQTPALAAYLAHTRTLAASLTHAWDLASLLIKPVQRLLKYPLLLGAILDETPDNHGDKENLRKAKAKMEEVARGVNEGRRRWEVVKEVLMCKPGEVPKKKGMNINVATSVNLGRMKNLRGTAKPTEGNEEATQVEQMVKDLKKTDIFINDIGKGTMEWCATVCTVVGQLRNWAVDFGKVIGLSEEQQSEAFDAFLVVVQDKLVPLCADLESVIKTTLLPELARLVATTRSPLRLIDAMNTLEPLHYGLLNVNFSKSRPPPALLDASQSYLALRGQLYAELPQYLRLLNRGITASIGQLGNIQTQFWADVRDRWGELWDALRVEGEMNAGAGETLRVWWERWVEVDKSVIGLNCVNPKRMYTEKAHQPTRMAASVSSMITSFDPPRSPPARSSTSSFAIPTMSSLDPSHVSAPFPLLPSPHKSRSRGNSLSTKTRRHSNDSLRSGKSGKSVKSGKSSRHSKADEFGEYVPIDAPDVPSMPIPMPPRTKSMPGALSVSPPFTSAAPSAPRSPVLWDDTDEYDERGRMTRKTSLRRKLTDSFRASSSHRRSSSVKSLGRSPPASSSPRGATFVSPPNHAISSPPPSRTSWEHARAKYLCRVVHPCDPPDGVSYNGLPFFKLAEDYVFEVLHEAGHPLTHPQLPLYVDDGEDCLLLVRDRHGKVGWALASFLIPED